jgi:adenine-specific DNA-methyltransferase
MYEITLPSGRVVTPPGGRCWRVTKEGFEKATAEEKMYYSPNGDGAPSIKRFLSGMPGMVPWTWWAHTEAGHSQEGKKESQKLFGSDNTFGTPKPERLIERVIHIATNPGDLVLDSFLGSGTTAAVAHKMGRRYIGVEMGDHAVSYCAPRLQKVVDGEQGGISESVNWQGGGGFRFYRLGPPVFDEEGHIRQDIRFPVLAAHVWFSEVNHPWNTKSDTPFLGLHDGQAYALLYNGILGDKRPNGGNVLTRATLAVIREEIINAHPDFDGPLTVYGEQSRLTAPTLVREHITFKQTPYDVKARA